MKTKHTTETNRLGTDELTGKNGAVRKPLQPYGVEVTIVGRDPILLHRYDCSAVEEKAGAAKNSKSKKTDNVESYVYRCPETNEIGLPGMVIKACLADAGKYMQDPRSPRKSARDLVRASIRIGGFSSFGKKDWDYLDRRRVVVQRNGITRSRPAFEAGWKLTFIIEVIDPEYMTPEFLQDLIQRAARCVGLCDYRPDFGTFRMVSFKVIVLE
jgi:hypothetical protein